MQGLLIREPWIDLILSRRKTWEMRATSTKKRGLIALIKSGSGQVYGVAELVEVLGPLSKAERMRNLAKQGTPQNVGKCADYAEIPLCVGRHWGQVPHCYTAASSARNP